LYNYVEIESLNLKLPSAIKNLITILTNKKKNIFILINNPFSPIIDNRY